MKKVLTGVVLLVTLFVLVACGGDKDLVLMELEGEDFSEKDYLGVLNEQIDPDEKKGIILEQVANKLVEEDLIDGIIEKELEKMGVEDIEELTADESGYIKEQAELEAGLLAVYDKSGIVTSDEIEEEYGDGKYLYEVSLVVVPESEEDNRKEVTKILKNGSDDLEEDILDVGEGMEFYVDTFTDFDMPFEFEELADEEVGYIGESIVEESMYVFKLDEKEELDLEDVRGDIVMKIGTEKEAGYGKIFEALEDKGIITIKKELRELLALDEDEVTE